MFRRVVALTMSLKLYLLLCTTIFFFTTTFATTNNAAYPSSYGEESCLLSGSNDIESIAERREVYGQGRIFDITHQYTPEVPMFGSADGIGDEFIRLRWSMKNGSRSNSSYMKMSVHTGTHVDAPSHFVDRYYDAGFDVDAFDLEVLNGPALVVDVPRDKNITADVMKSLPIPKGVMRVMFRTVNTDRRLMYKKAFDTSFVGFMTDGAQWLVDNTDIKLVGIDYLSIAAYDDLVPAHVALMEQKIIVVEGVKLDDVPAGIYDVHCLPLRLPRAEGSPIRCILIK